MGINAAWAYQEERVRREEVEVMGKTARMRRTVMEGRALRESRARVRDGFWYTENMSRAFPPPP